MQNLSLPLLAAILLAPLAVAAEVALPDTSVRELASKANGIEYKLYVSVPQGYETTDERYPVLYLLDADYSFPIVRGIVQHLSDRRRLPRLIVVGIAYGGPDRYRLNRTRDYTPTHTLEGGYGPEYQKVSGGAPKFLRFIADELIPWVDSTYRTQPGERGLAGHSYGGLFTTWVLLTAPRTFDRYIIVSPSLWYDGRFMFGLEEKSRKVAPPPSGAKVYLSVGAREGNAQRDMVVDMQRMAKRLRARNVPGLKVRDQALENETHDSVYPAAVSNGIRFAFDGD